MSYLSSIEKQVISALAQENEPVNLAKILQTSGLSASDLYDALQSLSRRCWLEKQEHLYTLSSVLKEYINDCPLNINPD